MEKYAESLGLVGVPKIKFLNREALAQRKRKQTTAQAPKVALDQAPTTKEEEDVEALATSSSDDDGSEDELQPSSKAEAATIADLASPSAAEPEPPTLAPAKVPSTSVVLKCFT